MNVYKTTSLSGSGRLTLHFSWALHYLAMRFCVEAGHYLVHRFALLQSVNMVKVQTKCYGTSVTIRQR